MGGDSVSVDRTSTLPAVTFAASFNVAVPFVDRHLEAGRADKIAIRVVPDSTRMARSPSTTPTSTLPTHSGQKIPHVASHSAWTC